MNVLGKWVMVVVGLAAILTGSWFAFPYAAESSIKRWFSQQGYREFSVVVSRPSFFRLTIVKLNFSHELKHERVNVHLRDLVVEYSLVELLGGRLDRVTVPDMSIVVQTVGLASEDQLEAEGMTEANNEPLDVFTVKDLVQGIPVLPMKELIVDRISLVREGATGPLRRASVSGTARQQDEGLFAEFQLRGDGVQPYVLRLSDLVTGVMSVQLERESEPRKPLAYWRTEVEAAGTEIKLHGQIELDIEQLAPFLAILLPLGVESSAASGRVQATWLGTAPGQTPLVSVWRHPATTIQGTVQGNVRLPEVRGLGRDVVIAATGEFHGNAQGIQWVVRRGTLLSAWVDARRIASLRTIRTYFPAGAYPVRIESTEDITGDVLWSQSPARFSLAGPLTLSYGATSSPLRVRVTASRLAGLGTAIIRGEGAYRVEGILPDTVLRPLGIGTATTDLFGSLQLEGQVLRGRFDQSSQLTASGLSVGRFAVDTTKMVIDEAVPFSVEFGTGEWHIDASRVLVNPSDIRLNDRRLRVEQATLSLQSVRGSRTLNDAQGTMVVRGITFVDPKGTVPPSDSTVRFTVDKTAAKAELEVKLRSYPVVVAAMVQHEWESQRGALHVTAIPVTFDSAKFRLRQLLSPWRYPMDVTGGSVSASFDLAWGPDPEGVEHPVSLRSGSGEVSFDRVSLQYRDIPLTGLSTTLAVRTDSGQRFTTTRPARLTVASVNPGVEITNLSMSVEADWSPTEALPTLEVREFTCELLGGILTSQGLRAPLGRPPYTFTLLVKHLDLQKVLSLEQQQGLEGTGILDGVVPVTIGLRGLAVKDGQFEARPPGGSIRYRASPEASKTVTRANAQMDLVLQALNNFQYNVLQVGAQYAEDGMLNLTARVEGRNPDLKQSPPIHFNLTVQENVPALLKSLRLAQDIGESVQKKLIRP